MLRKLIHSGLLIAFFCAAGLPLRAQNARITHTISHELKVPPQMGRDLWFTMILNYSAGGAGKYYALYVTSPVQTNVYVNMAGQATKVLPVQPYKVAAFLIPNGWEVISSAIVTNQAIHVWSKDGDLCAYLMSHNPYTSDGMYIIPTIGWGVDYVVAAYNALFEGGGGYVFDYPSEFAVVADQDNTVLTITPSADIRKEASPQACCSCLIHQKGVPFIDTLNRGQAIQYQTTCTQNTEDFDFTGTVVHSTKPIGVVGGSACPNIPMEDPYCDHVCDMMAPVRTWGQTYYTAPFYPAGPGKQWSSFYVITSKANQTIYRTDPVNGKVPYCTITKQYGTYLRPDIDQASKWESDASFSLVQYINSSTYPDGVNGIGDPAEVIINPVEQYTKKVVFQTPTSQGSQSPYANYVNIITNKIATATTLFDGQKLSGNPHMQIDGEYEITRMSAIKAGAHTAQSDSGVGVYVYGYGFDESYAWTGSFGTGTFNSPDTIAPRATASGSCFSAHVDLADTGFSSSQLNYIRLDSVYNMAYQRDSNWLEGAGRNSSHYDMYVIDSTKPAFLGISVFDRAGNLTTIASSYQPELGVINPHFLDFGYVQVGSTLTEYDTLTNTGVVPFAFTNLHLKNGKDISGFNLDSAVTTPLAVGERRLIKISFTPKRTVTSYDTIMFGDGCLFQEVLVLGYGRGINFFLSNYNFGAVRDSAINPIAGVSNNITITNISQLSSITIDSVWADSSEFTFLGNVPFMLRPFTDTILPFEFKPITVEQVVSGWHASSSTLGSDGKPLGVRNGTLTGNGFVAGVETPSDHVSLATLITIDNGKRLRATLPATWSGKVKLEMTGLLGVQVLATSFDAASSTTIEAGTLPSGVYFYRLTCGDANITGKIAIAR
jgi:hypothetical protein